MHTSFSGVTIAFDKFFLVFVLRPSTTKPFVIKFEIYPVSRSTLHVNVFIEDFERRS